MKSIWIIFNDEEFSFFIFRIQNVLKQKFSKPFLEDCSFFKIRKSLMNDDGGTFAYW